MKARRFAGPRGPVRSAGVAVLSMIWAASAAAGTHADLTYAKVGDTELKLDLYMPDGVDSPPLVVWIHGGAWRFGSKANPPASFVDSGFALASVEFRQSTEAPFPAMVHDIKAAIRYLRANADTYGYRADRIGISGASSGGHLAALVGVTNGVAELEGTLGEHTDASSDVQAILVYFGASNLTSILDQSTPRGIEIRRPALEQLLGGAPEDVPDVARLASPVFHVDPSDPPLLLLHGDQDPQMPINQAHELQGAYKAAGLDAELDVVHGAGHGGADFYNEEHWARAEAFLRRVLLAGGS
ncbi:MAG TPA: alpha/beta hydrolase [Gammaproteobacteria bacterium]